MTRRQFLAAAAAAGTSARAQDKPRLRRADSYFGLHFDLHPGPNDPALGRDVSEEMVEGILDAAKPDFVQYDAKGHAGWLGWPSEVGPSAPHIVNDSLAIWRKVTARRGVALYIHFSGVWDSEAVKRHPEWARGTPDGKPEDRQTSTFGPYVDRLMIPQLREAASKYDLDGVWVDGECWSASPDYSPMALAAWKQATGRDSAPKSSADSAWLEFLEFNRARFRQYVRHYVDQLHNSHPKFQVASNWLYSTFVPEKPDLPVDFLSGDYLGNSAISRARLEARYLESTGKPWDLMAWGFQQAQSNTIGHVHKPAVQLQQEASVVLSRGGGFQVYYVPSRAGYFEKSHVRTMGRIAEFCRARQSVSYKTTSASTAAVYFSRETLYETTGKLFGGWGHSSAPAEGWVEALADNQWSVDVLPDWKLESAPYSLIVVPEWRAISPANRDTLLAKARAGVRLIVSGAENARLFGPAVGLRFAGDAKDQPAFLPGGEVLANARGVWQDIEPSGTLLEQRFPVLDSRAEGKPAAVAFPLDRGELVLIPGPVGSIYSATHAAAVRQFVRRIVEPRLRAPVSVAAPPTVEMSLRRKDGKLLVHLLNTTGMQVAGDHATVDFVPDIGPVRLLCEHRPASARLFPGDSPLAVTPAGRQWAITIDRLGIHAAVALELSTSTASGLDKAPSLR